jgi:hypothetical protein
MKDKERKYIDDEIKEYMDDEIKEYMDIKKIILNDKYKKNNFK